MLDKFSSMLCGIDKRSARRSADTTSNGGKGMRPGVAAPKRRKGVRALYTDYGYIVNGVEYATPDEAYEANRD